ncbi:MAG TPA: hypothetical protein VFM37_11955 [Pseudonocardiaceae bacterium]|nr:hypothetical protein [Pseudonocardiaceae bacterium]
MRELAVDFGTTNTVAEARRELGGVPDRLVLTHPAGWGAVLYDADSAGLRCGLVEGEEADPMPRAELHGLWNGTIRPGS